MRIKIFSTGLLMLALLASCKPVANPVGKSTDPVASVDSTDRTNDFYDNEPAITLPGSGEIEISGEVAGVNKVDLSVLPKRTLIVKETRIENGEIQFVGAYRYDGVSLYDILNQAKVVKKNAKEFNPIIDQYVVVYNAAGDSVVFSWGEIYYSSHLHEIIIANKVTRIVPTKSKDKWPLPKSVRLIVGPDLITERNISDPTKIIIRSISIKYIVNRDIKMWSPALNIEGAGVSAIQVKELPEGLINQEFEHVFYGRGMGIHGITLTQGANLKDMLSENLKPDQSLIRNGLFAIAGVDGYRCAASYSEILNRNDGAAVLVQNRGEGKDGGKFSCLFTADFFSDRAIKSIAEIRLVQGL
jgi:hypothetical protein